MTVVSFQREVEKREPMIWKCDCGNCSFLIYENGELECAECGDFASSCNEHLMTIRKWTRKGDDVCKTK